MKTLTMAALAVSLLVAPSAFAQSTAPNATAAAKPASTISAAPAKHVFAVGEKLPGKWVERPYLVKADAYGLAATTFDTKWVVLEGTAYLIDEDTFVVLKVQPGVSSK
jgi:Ni/Co efflux regulator RcnB